jgi:hypothetical protein
MAAIAEPPVASIGSSTRPRSNCGGPDLGERDHLQHAVGHADTGAEDGHEPDAVGELLAGRGLQRRLDRHIFEPRVRERLVREQPRQLADQLAEELRLRLAAAQHGQLVAHERMPRGEDVGRGRGCRRGGRICQGRAPVLHAPRPGPFSADYRPGSGRRHTSVMT